MPNVSQQIKSYLGGISQQTDYEMQPGFLKDVINGYPDITYGLRKRPGLRYEFTLGDSVDYEGAYWFTISQAEIPPHIACIVPNGEVNVWNLITRQKLTANAANDYSYLSKNDKPFTTLNRDSFKCLSIQNVTVVLNRNCRVQSSSVLTPGTITQTVTTYGELADLTPKEDDIVHITNTPEEGLDDIFMLYKDGAWNECAKPGISDGVDDTTTAHILVILPDGTFLFGPGGSVRRTVGDLVTNPNPSFVGSFLTNIFFYLNRVGLLSRDNIFLSQPLRPDNLITDEIQKPNYFKVSSLTGSPADPIDLNASSVRATALTSVLPTVQGLVIFGDNEQFILYSEQGVVTPNTALIKSISTYEMSPTVDAVQQGDEYYFISKSQRNTRVFQLLIRGINDSPILNDVSKIITDYIPNSVDTLAANSQNQFISLSSSNEDKMYMYRVYKENGEVQFRSWYSWELPGKVLIGSYFDDRFFSTINCGSKIVIASALLSLVPEEDILTNLPIPDSDFPPGTREGVGPFLDLWISNQSVPTGIVVTPSNIKKTSTGISYWVDPIVTFPNDYPIIDGLTLTAVKTDEVLTRAQFSQDTSAGTGYTKDLQINANGQYYIEGKYKEDEAPASWVIGYRYTYQLILPNTYFRDRAGESDWAAYTNIDRYKFVFREASDLNFQLQRIGSSNWSDLKSVSLSDVYASNTPPITSEITLMLPIHQRNNQFNLQIISDSPFPVTLSKMLWEGMYNPRYYKRY